MSAVVGSRTLQVCSTGVVNYHVDLSLPPLLTARDMTYHSASLSCWRDVDVTAAGSRCEAARSVIHSRQTVDGRHHQCSQQHQYSAVELADSQCQATATAAAPSDPVRHGAPHCDSQSARLLAGTGERIRRRSSVRLSQRAGRYHNSATVGAVSQVRRSTASAA